MSVALHHELYVPRDSAVHHWTTRSKLLCLLAMMFAIALVNQVVLLPWIGLLVLWLYYLSQLPFRYLLRRLPYPGLFILATVCLLPFSSGTTVIWQWGWLSLRQEGVLFSVLVAGRFISIVTLGFILLGTTPFLDILGVMRSLRVPPLLIDMTLLTYRYLFEVTEQLTTMRQAMNLRGYRSGQLSLKSRWVRLTSLFGSLLLRSYDQSQRIYHAMRLRGYGQGVHVHPRVQFSSALRTNYLSLVTTVCTLSFTIANWILSR